MAAGLLVAANAQEAAEKDAKVEVVEEAKKPSELGALMKDQLIEIKDDKEQPAEFVEGMEYYVVYHSASW